MLPGKLIVLKAYVRKVERGTSLAVQWLKLPASNAGGAGSIPGQGNMI